MGKRKRGARQRTMWVATTDLPTTAAHPFYDRLNRILDDAGFDAYVEAVCAPFYAATVGRPSLQPGRYCRLLLVGYFEGLDAERAIAWRAADSFALRDFLRLELPEGSGLASELRAQGDFLSVAACEVRPEARKPVTHVHGP